MKFKSGYFLKDHYGEFKIKRKFMWIPKSFGEKYNRWLSFENILYTVVFESNIKNEGVFKWKPKKFATDEDLNIYKIEKCNKNWKNIFFLSIILFFLILYYFSNNNIFLQFIAAIIISLLLFLL